MPNEALVLDGLFPSSIHGEVRFTDVVASLSDLARGEFELVGGRFAKGHDDIVELETYSCRDAGALQSYIKPFTALSSSVRFHIGIAGHSWLT